MTTISKKDALASVRKFRKCNDLLGKSMEVNIKFHCAELGKGDKNAFRVLYGKFDANRAEILAACDGDKKETEKDVDFLAKKWLDKVTDKESGKVKFTLKENANYTAKATEKKSVRRLTAALDRVTASARTEAFKVYDAALAGEEFTKRAVKSEEKTEAKKAK